METLGMLAQGFAIALTPENLLWSFVGVTLGTAAVCHATTPASATTPSPSKSSARRRGFGVTRARPP